MNMRDYRGQYGEEPAIVATAAGAVAAFAAMTGEAAGVAAGRTLLVTGVRASGAGAFSFAIRANNGTATRVLYPPSLDLVRVGDGIRYFIDTDLEIRVENGEFLEWISAEGVAKEVSVQNHRLQRAPGT